VEWSSIYDLDLIWSLNRKLDQTKVSIIKPLARTKIQTVSCFEGSFVFLERQAPNPRNTHFHSKNDGPNPTSTVPILKWLAFHMGHSANGCN
jgi:hypothetical protein